MKPLFNKLLQYLHLENQWKSFFLLTLIMNFLYCSLQSIVTLLCNAYPEPLTYYPIQYALYLILSIIYYLLFTQFIRNRNNDKDKIKWNSFIFPLIKFETIFFVFFCIINIASFYTYVQMLSLRYVFLILSILCTLIYFPLRLYGYHQIYHQQKNPFIILKNGLYTLFKHYVSLFYSWLAMAILFSGSFYLASYWFDLPSSFQLISITSQLLTCINPFIPLYQLMAGTQSITIFNISYTLIIGILLSLAMLFYFSYLINVFDEEVNY